MRGLPSVTNRQLNLVILLALQQRMILHSIPEKTKPLLFLW